MTTTYNLEIKQGSDFIDSITLLNENGSVKDLTGCQAYMQIKDYPWSETSRISLSTVNTKLQITALTGVIQIRLNSVDTALLVNSFGCYDLLLLEPSGLVSTVVEGEVRINRRITEIVL